MCVFVALILKMHSFLSSTSAKLWCQNDNIDTQFDVFFYISPNYYGTAGFDCFFLSKVN